MWLAAAWLACWGSRRRQCCGGVGGVGGVFSAPAVGVAFSCQAPPAGLIKELLFDWIFWFRVTFGDCKTAKPASGVHTFIDRYLICTLELLSDLPLF